MTLGDIRDAKKEAERFIITVEKCLEDSVYCDRNDQWHMSGTKHTAAVRRASMDLTRSLAEMRRPPR